MLATIVQIDPIYVNFNVSERMCCSVRADLRAAARRPRRSARSFRSKSGCRPRAAIRTTASSTTSRRPSIRRPERWRRAPSCRMPTGSCCPAISCAFAFPRQPQPALLVPDVALGSDQGGRYVLVVNKDNVIEQRKVEPGQLVGDLRVIDKGLRQGRPRRHRRHHARHPGRKGRPRDAQPRRPPCRRAIADRRHDLEILHRAAGARECAGHPDDFDRRGRALRPADRAISQRRAADRAGDDALSRRQRPHADGHGGAADRAAGQRRREHALHAIDAAPATAAIRSPSPSRSAPISISRRCWCRTGWRARWRRCRSAVQAQGVTVQKKSTAILQFVTLTSPRWPLRQPLSRQLRHHQSQGRAVAAARRRQRQRVRRRPIFDARLARSGQAAKRAALTPQDVIQALQQQSQQVTAGQVGMPPTPARQRFPVHDRRPGPPRRSPTNSPTSSSRPAIPARSRACAMSAASSLARRPIARFSRLTASRRPASASFNRRTPTRWTSSSAVKAKMEELGAPVPAGPGLRDSVRHHGLRQCLDPRGLQDADRGRGPRADRHPRVPAGLARHAGAGHHGAGDDHRRFRRDVRRSASR